MEKEDTHVLTKQDKNERSKLYKGKNKEEKAQLKLQLDKHRPPFLGRHFCGFTDVQPPAEGDVHHSHCPDPTIRVDDSPLCGGDGVFRCARYELCKCGRAGGRVAVLEKVCDKRVERARNTR